MLKDHEKYIKFCKGEIVDKKSYEYFGNIIYSIVFNLNGTEYVYTSSEDGYALSFIGTDKKLNMKSTKDFNKMTLYIRRIKNEK